jgi:hypothetical protein
MSKTVNLQFNLGVPLADQCSHGKRWAEYCRECRLVSLRESLDWMERQVMRDRAEYEQLLGQSNDLVSPVAEEKGLAS